MKPTNLDAGLYEDSQHVADLVAEVRWLRGMVYDLSDSEACDYDHDDYCQTHWPSTRPCANDRANDYLALLPNNGKPESAS